MFVHVHFITCLQQYKFRVSCEILSVSILIAATAWGNIKQILVMYAAIIWVVGEKGNEGKSFFQSNEREEFSYSRVSVLELGETARNIYHILGKLCILCIPISSYSTYQEEDIYLMNNIKYLSQSKMDGLCLQSMTVGICILRN